MPQPNPSAPRYQVLLSHNSQDKPLVQELKRLLTAKGITSWFDKDELRPGLPWQPLIDNAIKNSDSVPVLVGSDGLGPWQDEEMQAALRLAVKLRRPVIPVLLPGAPKEPDLPSFLANRTWVDGRNGWTEELVEQLVWGITGQRSASSQSAPAPTTPPATPPIARPNPGRAKNEFCDHVGDDWQKLANELGIVSADQRQIAAKHPGTEGRGIWDWLENRRQLARLAPACRAIERADLADALPPDLGAPRGPADRPR